MKRHILYLVFMLCIMLVIACDSSRRTYITAPSEHCCDSLVVNHRCFPPGHCKDKPGKPVGEITVDSLK